MATSDKNRMTTAKIPRVDVKVQGMQSGTGIDGQATSQQVLHSVNVSVACGICEIRQTGFFTALELFLHDRTQSVSIAFVHK